MEPSLFAVFKLHQRRVTAAVAVEDLFARQADLDGTSRGAREVRDYDLVVERSDLPPKPPPLGVAMTRIFAAGISRTFASAR
jgi:hypothetical protein